MFSIIRLLLIINNHMIPKRYIFIDFICIILLCLIVLYIEKPFRKVDIILIKKRISKYDKYKYAY